MSKSLLRFISLLLLCGIADQSVDNVAGHGSRLGAESQPSSSVRIDALAPAVCAASFQPSTYDRAVHIRIDRGARAYGDGNHVLDVEEASVRASWSAAVIPFARVSGRRASKAIDTVRVQELVQTTRSRAEAIERLRHEFGWSTSATNLSKYLRRQHLNTTWQKAPPDRSLITKIVQHVRSEAR
jgi:hypothetical protein